MAGRDQVTQKGWGFAPSVGFGLGTRTPARVSYQHLRQHNLPDHGLPGALPDLAVERAAPSTTSTSAASTAWSRATTRRSGRMWRRHDRPSVQPDAQPAEPDPIREEQPRSGRHVAARGHDGQ